MDDIVKAALKKWPNVPDCYGWLALDARGDWYMRDDRIQAAGPFPQVKGSRIDHAKLKEFIQRNYDHDERGAWFFQNGPQRVYVTLEAAPLVWRVDPTGAVCAHTGAVAAVRGPATVAAATVAPLEDKMHQVDTATPIPAQTTVKMVEVTKATAAAEEVVAATPRITTSEMPG